MNYKISSAEASTLLIVLESMLEISKKSPVIATLIGLNLHELNKVKALIERITPKNKHKFKQN